MYDTYGPMAYGILLQLANNDKMVAEKLMVKVFVEVFNTNYCNSQTGKLPFVIIMQAIIETGKRHNYTAAAILAIIFPPPAAIGKSHGSSKLS
ncbi:MAG: hypothetical protein ABIR15_05895 [Chitinophagaceae bacterium]